jgi:ATP/maltotriose-dependent transcriptional regulator MalT
MFTRVIDNHAGHRIGCTGMSSQRAQTDDLGLRVIEPKIALPRVQPGMLRRSRLLEMVDGDGRAALTVVNAPVGYGKTTLLRLWCIECAEAVVWMTLDAADDDSVRLWTHLATAVERLARASEFGRSCASACGVRWSRRPSMS